LSALQAALQPATFAVGENLCREGETGDRMFIIESGEIAVLKAVEGGEPI
jgi:CRP-like cAMP-binding protein